MPTDRTFTRRTSAVYAEVLLQAAIDADAVFEVSGQLEQVLGAIRGNVELRNALMDRTLPAETRSRVATEVFAGLDAGLLQVLGVMLERDDIMLLGRVSEVYGDLAERELDAVIIDVTTVVGLDEGLRDQIRTKYATQFGKGVFLREHIDPTLVGGIVLSAHGRRIDASVVSQLKGARAVLSTVSSGGDR
jgi:F-type H+-transporting ATPase subunit delta